MDEYEIYLPRVPPEKLHAYHDELVAQFGGLTDTRHRFEGTWRVGRAEVRDEILLWRVLSDRGEDGVRFMRELRARLERDLQQDEILIVRRAVERV